MTRRVAAIALRVALRAGRSSIVNRQSTNLQSAIFSLQSSACSLRAIPYELIAGGHSNLTYSVTDATGARVGAAPSTARPGARHRPRHGSGAPHHLGARSHRRPGPADHRPVHRRGGQRSAVLRDGLRRRPRGARCTGGRGTHRRANVARRASRSSTCSPRSTPSTSTPSASATSARRRTTSSASCKRWYGQFQGSDAQVPGGLDLPSVHEAHDTLAEQVPDQGPATIVHGDYRLDNCMLGADGDDRRRCSTGSSARSAIPLADLGLLCVYWADADGQAVLPQASPTAMEGFPDQDRAGRRGTPRCPAATSPPSTSTSRSATGSSPASSPACTPATPAGRWATCPASQVAGFRAMVDTLAELTDRAIDRIRLT